MRKYIIALLSLVVVFGGYYVFFTGKEESPYVTEKVRRRDIIQTVSVTGTVSADPTIDMSFQQNGQIEAIYVKEGQSVNENQLIAELENDDLEIRVQSAKANLAFHQAQFDKEIAGATNEDVRIAALKVDRAEKDLENSKVRLSDTRKLNQTQIETAEFKVSDAEVSLQKSESDLEFAKEKQDEDLKAAEQRLFQANIALENSKTNLNDVRASSSQKVEDAYEDMPPVFDKALITAQENLQAVDNILGVDSASIVDDDKILLGAKDPSSIDSATESYKAAKLTRDEVTALVRSFEETLDREEIEHVKNEVSRLLHDARQALDDTYTVLENSVSNEENSSLTNELKKLKDFIIAEQNDNTTTQDTLNGGWQTLQNALIARDSNINAAETDVDVKSNEVANATINLDLTKVSGENTLKNAELTLAQNQERLKQSQQSLKETKVKAENSENDLNAEISLKENALENSQAEYAKVIAKPRNVDIAGLQANIDKAESDVDEAEVALEKTRLRSPVNGLAVKINKDVGENVTPNDVVAVINSRRLLISANVSESDIGKVQIDNPSTMTFDAFSFNEEFNGKVVEVAAGETIVEGVVYYEVKVSFDVPDKGREVKSGMTANLKILTDTRKNVLSIPLRAVKFKEKQAFVQIVEGGQLKEKEIKIGLEGDQYVEVLEGLSESEEIVTFTQES